ncbi:GGDEF domain-containing protein [Sulfurimonas sp.]|uniref:bifunctional diguanylate cyclase/phosphodiesterase n=1 Tax=Sulfurimonas sp. TaxID=2022749 RepID=UPI002B4701FA|nr:GGDEF domain-containing protein [Sulfurimonas sp.]
MLLPQTKEREYRFKLALRMGLPIFGLVMLLVTTTFLSNDQSLNPVYLIEFILLIAFNIYFIFYIIYNSFDVRITELVTKTFTKEYLFKYLKKEIKKNDNYTLLLISIDNLHDINDKYGIKNGDKVLNITARWIGNYFKEKGLDNFPMGHIKGGDFVIGLRHKSSKHFTMLELFCLKSDDFMVDDIEVKISVSMTDTLYSRQLDYLIENLFELQAANKEQKIIKENTQEIDPNKLESFVIAALKNRSFIVMSQNIFENNNSNIQECFVKLKTSDEKIIHQKTYMKIFDKLGLMADFDFMILEENIVRYKENNDKVLAINISPTSLRNQKFVYKAKELIISNKKVKDKIIFLLNESHYYSQTFKYNKTLNSFRELGVKIAIDRLGAIHSSFIYLRDLDIDIVRFDSFYTKDIKSIKNRSTIEGFSLMAQERGIKTWVKMIETQDINEIVKDLKIDYTQGMYLAPMIKKYESEK